MDITELNNPFTKKNYNSSDGMMTSIWGPSMWLSLHIISFNYPIKPTKEQKDKYYNYIMSLKYILPCLHCRKNVVKNLKDIKFNKSSMKSRDTFSRAIYNLHESINKMLDKKSNLTYIQVRNIYEHFRSRCLIENPINNLSSKKEKGCIVPLYGKKTKCVLDIVPKNSKKKSLNISKKCKIEK